MRSFAIAAAAVFATGCATTNHIQDHVGVHVHADIGFAGSSSSAKEYGESAEMSGGGGAFSVAVGGAVVPNLILGGEIWGVGVSEPEARDWDGTRYDMIDTTLSAYGLGPRITYYAMPVNLYFSLTPSFTQLALSDDYSEYSEESRWGFGLRGAIGKEWFVSPRWGLGLAGVMHASGNKWPEGGPRWKTWGAGLVFSASYN